MISNSIQMGSSVCLFRNALPSLALLASFVVFAVCSDFGILSILLTTSVLISGAVIFAILRPNSAPKRKSARQESDDERDETDCAQEKEAEEVQFASESESTITGEKGCQRGEERHVCDHLLSSVDASSDTTQSIDHNSGSEDSEIEWPFKENQACSDGSISDEESLIEITLPNGHFVEPKKQFQPKYWADNCPKLGQQTLMDLLAEINEMNEEENLIEIDISRGSIKCPRFEIQA
ncbi:hypothetical protein Ancab_010791 [Ancistrocladus abbreviatus]